MFVPCFLNLLWLRHELRKTRWKKRLKIADKQAPVFRHLKHKTTDHIDEELRLEIFNIIRIRFGTRKIRRLNQLPNFSRIFHWLALNWNMKARIKRRILYAPNRIAKLSACKMRRLNQLNATYFNSMRVSRIFDWTSTVDLNVAFYMCRIELKLC